MRLLRAAARVFARRGYEGATVPEIAAEAGLSTGAIYSNFDGKADLFHTLMAQEIGEQQRIRLTSVAESATEDDAIAVTAAQWAGYVEENRESVLLLLEFCLAGARDEQIRPAIAQELAHVRDNLTEATTQVTGSGQADMAPAVQALAYGYALQRLLDPETIEASHFNRALYWLITGHQTSTDKTARGSQ